MKYVWALWSFTLVASGAAAGDLTPPWDQEAQFEQATEQLHGLRVVDKRVLAWSREIREVRNSKETIRFDCALLWFEIEGSKEGRYLVIEAVRSPATTGDRWEPISVIGDSFGKGPPSYFPGYRFFHERPGTKDLLPLASWLMQENLDRHVMKADWRIATGEEPPTVP
jgi:hypothetical protein